MDSSKTPIDQLTEDEAKDEINRLRRICLVHRYLYYVLNDPVISDLQYDKFENRLREILKLFPHLSDECDYHWCCPTRVVGSEFASAYPLTIPPLAQSIHDYAVKLNPAEKDDFDRMFE